MKFVLVFLSLILIIFLSGCTYVEDWFGKDVIQVEEKTLEGGVKDVLVINDITILPSSPVLPDRDVILSFVVENRDTRKNAENVVVELFDAPLFKNKAGTLCNGKEKPCQPDLCRNSAPCTILPGEQKLISFDLIAPSIDDIAMLETEVELRFRVNYDFHGSLLYNSFVISMDEIKSRQRAGESVNLEIRKIPGSGPIQIDVELMGAPYILSGYSGTFLFTIKKVGDPNGILKDSKILPEKLKMEFPSDFGTAEAKKFKCNAICKNSEDIELYKGESPKLYFRISNVPTIDVPYKSFIIDAEVDYRYELRDSIKVKIKPYV